MRPYFGFLLTCLVSSFMLPAILVAHDGKAFDILKKNLEKDMPLMIENADIITNIDLYAETHVDKALILRNISGKSIRIKRIIATCPCLSILDKEPPTVIEAHQSVPLHIRIDGRRIAIGDFSKMFFVSVEGHEMGFFNVTGKVTRSVSFEPAMAYNLEDSFGNIPWERIITLKTSMKEDIKLKLDKKYKYFDVNLKQLSEHEYKLLISPKLPLPQGTYRQIFTLSSDVIPNFGPIETGIFMRVHDITRLDCYPNKISIPTQKINTEKYIEVNFKIVAKRIIHDTDSKERYDSKKVFTDPISSKEEKGAWPLDKIDTWVYLHNSLSIQAPDGAIVKMTPQTDHIAITARIPTQVFEGQLFISIRFQKDNNDTAAFFIFRK